MTALLPTFAQSHRDIAPLLNRVHHCDALDLLARLPDGSVDMWLTSPPYDNLRTYKGFSWDFEAIARESYRVLKPGGVGVWVVGDATINGSETLSSFRQALYFKDMVGYNIHDTMIYEVAGTGAKGSIYSYWQAFEYMFVLSKGRPKTINLIADIKNNTASMKVGEKQRGENKGLKQYKVKDVGIRKNIWRYQVGFMDNSDKTGHPAPFPEKLAGDHIITWSNPGDIILDFFMGSGTTAKMAQINGRKFIGCDIAHEYVDIARRRLAQPYTPDMFAMQQAG